MQTEDTPSLALFPLKGNLDSIGVLEITTEQPLTAELKRLVSGVLRLYLNFQALLDYGERDALTELRHALERIERAGDRAVMYDPRGVALAFALAHSPSTFLDRLARASSIVQP